MEALNLVSKKILCLYHTLDLQNCHNFSFRLYQIYLILIK